MPASPGFWAHRSITVFGRGFVPEVLDPTIFGTEISELTAAEIRPNRATVTLPDDTHIDVRVDRMSVDTHAVTAKAGPLLKSLKTLIDAYPSARLTRTEVHFAKVVEDGPRSWFEPAPVSRSVSV